MHLVNVVLNSNKKNLSCHLSIRKAHSIQRILYEASKHPTNHPTIQPTDQTAAMPATIRKHFFYFSSTSTKSQDKLLICVCNVKWIVKGGWLGKLVQRKRIPWFGFVRFGWKFHYPITKRRSWAEEETEKIVEKEQEMDGSRKWKETNHYNGFLFLT